NPLSTRLVLEAKKRGIKAAGGLYMLVMQAVIAAELFSGSPLEDGAAENIYADILLKKCNIVLTGMPGSGKSTVGQILAERLQRPFIDIDADIVNTCGMPITDIFKTRGEEYFRDVESAAIAEASGKNGAVIATGGGAVLRARNVDALKMNGKIIFMDSPLKRLVPTSSRPLSDTEGKLKALYNERYPIYMITADAVIPAQGAPGEAADAIERCLL
ncbi:MAG: shikimate dehydrogenase, partial [Clostridia bacterium]|nr:shikimate dehydrogenase [Clostridia bacterium]